MKRTLTSLALAVATLSTPAIAGPGLDFAHAITGMSFQQAQQQWNNLSYESQTEALSSGVNSGMMADLAPHRAPTPHLDGQHSGPANPHLDAGGVDRSEHLDGQHTGPDNSQHLDGQHYTSEPGAHLDGQHSGPATPHADAVVTAQQLTGATQTASVIQPSNHTTQQANVQPRPAQLVPASNQAQVNRNSAGIAKNSAAISDLQGRTDSLRHDVDENKKAIKRVGAMSQAVAGLHYNGLVSGYGVAVGAYDGATAVAAGVQYRTSEHTAVTLQASYDGNAAGGSVGLHGDF